MTTYTSQQIRNIALVGHQGSGKTMLAEAMLHTSGAIPRMGSIEEGSTLSDYHSSEQERQMSIFTSLLHAEWEDYKINILDTPGYADFVGEVVAAMKVADLAVYVMNAAEGVQVGTELAWSYGAGTDKPSMFVINHLDKAESDFRVLVSQIKERFGRGATVVQIPAGAGTRSIIDVLRMQQITYPKGGAPQVGEIDEAFRSEADELHEALIEDIAENDVALMERYFEEGTLTEEEMSDGLHEAMIRRELYPIFVTSATENVGVSRLMSFITNVAPSPVSMPPARTVDGGVVEADAGGDPVVFIYRTMAEEHVGDFSFYRVYSGTIESGQDLENSKSATVERLGQLYAISGRRRVKCNRMVAGDLGALVKLKNTHTNDTLHPKGQPIVIEPIQFPEPRYRAAIRPVHEGEEDKLAQGLHQIVEEDPSLEVIHDPHLSQVVLGGQGERHLDVAKYRLKHRAGVEVVFSRPRVAYRETVQGRARASYRHKKQTGGAGQFADISMLVEPFDGDFNPPDDVRIRDEAIVETDWGSKLHFIDAIVGGVIDMRRFFGAIQKGVSEKAQEGPLAGYPIGDVRIVIYDGGMHSVDSNENAFRTAARMCFIEAFRQASPTVLEPIHNVEITIPSDDVGDVMSDLNTRRGRIQGIEAQGFFQKIVAEVPEAELFRYSTLLRSMTHGRGLHKSEFSHYEPMPRHLQEELMAEVGQLQEA